MLEVCYLVFFQDTSSQSAILRMALEKLKSCDRRRSRILADVKAHCIGLAVLCLQTPVTSSPLVAGFLSNLPAYRIGVSPLLRGVEIGLVHGLLVTGRG